VEPPEGALRPRLYPGTAERSAVDAVLGAWAHEPLIAMAPGSVWGTKRWPYYSMLASRLSGRHKLVVVGGPDDAELAAGIVAAAEPRMALDATGKLSLLGSSELLARARLLITNDSSPQHLASAMNTPTIALFGPTVPAFGFGPLAPHSLIAELPDLPCRPCHHHGPSTCPLTHWKCMRDLSVDRVEELVNQVLK
jgi:heptosyltransferase-2